jgi:hypothetical protein
MNQRDRPEDLAQKRLLDSRGHSATPTVWLRSEFRFGSVWRQH